MASIRKNIGARPARKGFLGPFFCAVVPRDSMNLQSIWLIRLILENITYRHFRIQPIRTSGDTAAQRLGEVMLEKLYSADFLHILIY